MTRIIPLIVFLALVGGLFFLPSPDPVRLAAVQAGTLLLEPAELPPEVDWREALAAGDLVEATDGREGEVVSVADERVVLLPRGASESFELQSSEVARVIERRPFWRALVDGPASTVREDGTVEIAVRGYRMLLDGTPYKDHRLHGRVFESCQRSLRSIAAEKGFKVEFNQRIRKDFPGLILFCEPAEGQLTLHATFPDETSVGATRVWHPPTSRSLIPPLVAILLAMIFRRPLLALATGVVLGSVLEQLMHGASLGKGTLTGAVHVVTRYLPREFLEPTRLQIAIFIVCMLALVGIMTRAGGIRGLMDRLALFARDARRSQVATFFIGMVVFFDHYANTILVGTTMRPLTDRFKVAREKLAYLVDSTAAPVAGLSIFSTWIAFEVSTFSVQLPEAGMAASQGYEIFLRTMPYRFYSLFTLFLVGLIVFTGKDFGPMLRAERRARRGKVMRDGARPLVHQSVKDLEPVEGARILARTALVPLATFLFVTIGAILVKGGAFSSSNTGAELGFSGFSGVIFRGSGAGPLMIGALAGLVMACVMTWLAGIPREIPRGAWAGLRSMGAAIALLYLAWMIGAVCHDLGTTSYLAVLLKEALNPLLLPVILFGIAGLVAFSTGTPWSTMTILLPLVVGIAFEAGKSTPIGGEGMLIVAIGAVLEGAIFGDHCSPISDTTVMSSIASASDHVDHVRTQAPYAILAMVVAVLFGYYPAVIIGLSPILSLLLGAAALTLFMKFYGRRAESSAEPERRPFWRRRRRAVPTT